MSRFNFIITDIDGTLLGFDEQPQDYFELRTRMNALKSDDGCIWALMTGRHLKATVPLLQQFLIWGLAPDYIVVEDARIYKRKKGAKLSSYILWNMKIDLRRVFSFLRYRKQILNLKHELFFMHPKAEDLSRRGIDIWVKLQDLEEAVQAETFLIEHTTALPSYMVFRWGKEVCLASSIGSKGDALAHLSKQLKLNPAGTFAIGDGANDLSMLSSKLTGMPACVANAESRVKQAVNENNGYQASRPALKGVIEAIQHFREN